jgi:putative drug exporter of the RND superfamily
MLIVMPTMQSMGGGNYLRRMRKIVTEEAPWKDSPHGFLVFGDILPLVDAVDEVFTESPPIIAAVALVVIFLMSGAAFRSLLIPVRLLGTVVVTLVIVSGSIVFAYQYASGWTGESAGVYWFVGLCSVPLVIGLTIDYDVFLISRIYEFRHRGFTTEASILRGMAKQSTTITTAGIIMTIAFSSLMLADVTVLNQFGFILVTASLADTFVVRTMLVPALLGFFPETNWWPGKVPPPLKTHLVDVGGLDEEEEENGVSSGGGGLFDDDVFA